jgi:N-methylhydantoinase A
MLASPLRGEAVRTVLGPLDSTDLRRAFADVERAAIAELGDIQAIAEIARYAELRYAGQEHTLEVPVPDPAALGQIRAAFERRCIENYSFRLDASLEVVALRVSASRPGEEISWADQSQSGPEPPARTRVVDLDPYLGPQPVAVLLRAELADGWTPGPCVIEEPAATTLVLPGQAARADEAGNLIIEERP